MTTGARSSISLDDMRPASVLIILLGLLVAVSAANAESDPLRRVRAAELASQLPTTPEGWSVRLPVYQSLARGGMAKVTRFYVRTSEPGLSVALSISILPEPTGGSGGEEAITDRVAESRQNNAGSVEITRVVDRRFLVSAVVRSAAGRAVDEGRAREIARHFLQATDVSALRNLR